MFATLPIFFRDTSAAGSPVRLQTWNHMVHVWQIFNPELTEARDALAEIGRFLAESAPFVEREVCGPNHTIQ